MMNLNNYVTTKTFQEPLLDIIDEEEDIDLDALRVENKKENQ